MTYLSFVHPPLGAAVGGIPSPSATLLIHGDSLDDASGAGNVATPFNAVSVDGTHPVLGGPALLFGSGGYLTLPHSAALDLTSGDWTIDFRLRRGLGAVNELYLNKGVDSASLYPWQFWRDNADGKVGLRGFNAGGTLAYDLKTLASVPSSTWHAVRGERAGNTVSLYLNGALQASATVAGTLWAASSLLSIGAYGNGLGASSDLRLAEIHIAKGVALAGAAPTYAVPTQRYY